MRRVANLICAGSLCVYATFVAMAQQPTKTTAAVPRLVKYSGTLTGSGSQPLTGVVGVTFALYEEERGGAPLWMETQNVQADGNGRYTALLGATRNDGIPAEVFASGQVRWLGVQPQGEPERPRILMASVPYALKAVDAETLGGLPASAFALAGTANHGTANGEATESAAGPGRTAQPVPAATPDQTGSGTANYITMWTAATVLGNSKLYQTASGNVGLGTTTPTAKLEAITASTTGTGVLGYAASATGANVGVTGKTPSTTGTGVLGEATATSGANLGVSGQSASSSGSGVYGNATATSGYTSGVYGTAASPNGIGVLGYTAASGGTGVNGTSSATAGSATGVWGQSNSTSGNGVVGTNTATAGSGNGVYGQSASTGGNGVVGTNIATSGYTAGVNGQSASPNGAGVSGQNLSASGGNGVYGQSNATSGYGNGGYFQTTSPGGNGVVGFAMATSGNNSGVAGTNASTNGTGVGGTNTATSGYTNGVNGQTFSPNGTGVIGLNNTTSGGTGVTGYSPGIGVQGISQTCVGGCTYMSGVAGQFVTGPGGTVLQGVYGPTFTQVFYVDASGNGFFAGNLNVTGKVTKGSGSFKIDHPLDPANKYLSHSFVESPDMKDMYDGTVTTDARGLATVALPDYFEALNGDFRYQLTVIGQFAQAIVAKEIGNGRFTIKTNRPRVKVSWQVTGIRHDAYANAHRIPVSEDKPGSEQGTYLHPDVFGQGAGSALAAGSH